MKNVEFTKKVNPTLLDRNLQKAGLVKGRDYYGVTVIGDKTIVHLSDNFEYLDLVAKIVEKTGLVDAELLKSKVDEFTQRYIAQKVLSIDEELTDLTTEYALYLSKTELTEYEQQRKAFIEALFNWKERVWSVEEQIEEEIDSMTDEQLIKFERNLEKIVMQRYEKKLGELFEQVKSLQV